MNSIDKNSLSKQKITQIPKQNSVSLDTINVFDEDEFMKFKLYENVKSRHVRIHRCLIFY